MPTHPTKTIKLHPAQRSFRHSKAIWRGFIGGRGSGKSWCGAYDLLCRAKRGHTYLVASPTGTKLNDETFPTFKKVASEFGVMIQSVKLTPYPTVQLTTGAEIRFRSAERPDALRGPNLSGIWLDEAGLMEKDVYTICIGCLREHGEQGWLSATFTPNGTMHWTYEIFGKGGPNKELFHARTWENPFNPSEFYENLKHEYAPMLARQELAGEFLDMDGAEFPAAWFDWPGFWFTDWPPGITMRVMSLDPSKGRDAKTSDYSAFVMLARDAVGQWYCEANLARRNVVMIVDEGLALPKKFERETGGGIDGLVVEANQFQELLYHEFAAKSKRLDAVHLPIFAITNTAPKIVRIRRLTPYLSLRSIRFRDTPGTKMLVEQLQSFPVGEFDDGPDALDQGLRLAADLWQGKGR